LDLRKVFLLVSTVFLSAVVFAAPWDVLREPVAWLGTFEPFTSWALLIVSLGLFGVAVLALKKKSSSKLKWVGAAFGLFFLKALLVVLDLYVSSGNFMNYAIQGFFDLIILGILFVALFRK